LSFFARFPFGPILLAFYAFVCASLRSRAALQLEILALRDQLGVDILLILDLVELPRRPNCFDEFSG
jgi:hypothetical protein